MKFKETKKTVFVWGTFDLIRAGHIRYLKRARAAGDTLVVGVYSDAVAARLNHKTRPIIPQKERMEILSSFSIVDRVILLTQPVPSLAIQKVAPDIIVSCDPDRKLTTDLIQKIRDSFSVSKQ